MPPTSQTSDPSHPNAGFLARAHRVFFYFGGAYAILVILLAIPFFQLHAVFLHAIKLPLFANFDLPEKYGLAPGKALNVHISTPDNITLGAWFVLSDDYYQSHHPTAQNIATTHLRPALSNHPTILFLHGNAATRAIPFRVQHYSAFSSRLGANVFAIDYRGFGDSQGKPSEEGLKVDARAALDWLMERGAKSENILVVGHSLGTGVAVGVAKELGQEGVNVKGVVLLAPFSNIRRLVETYSILGLFPLIRPLHSIPYLSSLVMWFLVHDFDSLSAIPDVKAPILLAHAENDYEIGVSHSRALFTALIEPLLPALPESITSLTQGTAEQYDTILLARRDIKAETVKIEVIESFGQTEEFKRREEDGGGKVVFVRSKWGGHDRVGLMEGVQDVIKRTFGL